MSKEARKRAKADARLRDAAPALLAGLHHMMWCRSCAEGSWEDCEGGRAALAALAKASGDVNPKEGVQK